MADEWKKATDRRIYDTTRREGRNEEEAGMNANVDRDAVEHFKMFADAAAYDPSRKLVAAPRDEALADVLNRIAEQQLLRNDPKFMQNRARGETTISSMSYMKLCDAFEIDPAAVLGDELVRELRTERGRAAQR